MNLSCCPPSGFISTLKVPHRPAPSISPAPGHAHDEAKDPSTSAEPRISTESGPRDAMRQRRWRRNTPDVPLHPADGRRSRVLSTHPKPRLRGFQLLKIRPTGETLATEPSRRRVAPHPTGRGAPDPEAPRSPSQLCPARLASQSVLIDSPSPSGSQDTTTARPPLPRDKNTWPSPGDVRHPSPPLEHLRSTVNPLAVPHAPPYDQQKSASRYSLCPVKQGSPGHHPQPKRSIRAGTRRTRRTAGAAASGRVKTRYWGPG